MSRKNLKAHSVAFRYCAVMLAVLLAAPNQVYPTHALSEQADLTPRRNGSLLAQAQLNCQAGSIPGFELSVIKKTVSGPSVICNYAATSTVGRKPTSGTAITIEYACATDTQDAWKAKTSQRPKWNPKANPPVLRGEVKRDSNLLLLREDGSFSGYAGDFSVQQKLFLLIDSQTLATLVVLTDVAQPRDDKTQPDPNVLNLPAEQAVDLARALASAHGALKQNLTCAPAAASDIVLSVGFYRIKDDEPNKIFLQVKVVGESKAAGSPIAPKEFAPLDVSLYLKDALIETALTDAAGVADFEYMLGEDPPPGRTEYEFKAVAEKAGLGSAERRLTVIIERGLAPIVVALEAINGEYSVGDNVQVKGRVWSLANGLFMDSVPADLSVIDQFGVPLGGAPTDESGFFSFQVPLNGLTESDLSGTQELIVQASPRDDKRYQRGEGKVRFIFRAKGKLSVSVATDKPIYLADEQVAVFGQVSGNSKPVAVTVDILYNRRLLKTVATDQDGKYRFEFSPVLHPPPNSIAYRPPELNEIVVIPRAADFDSIGGKAFFSLIDEKADCMLGEIPVIKADGHVMASRPDLQSNVVSPTTPVNVRVFPVLVKDGSRLTQGIELYTTMGAKVTLRLGLGEGAAAKIAVGDQTTVTIARYCRDKSGKVHVALLVDKPGNVMVDAKQTGSATANYQINIISPAVSVKNVKTRYLVTAAQDGTTTVAVVEGLVVVGDPQGGHALELGEGKQITVRVGEFPDPSKISSLIGQVDPRLVDALGAPDSLPADNQPQPNPTGMTLQAAQHFVIAGDLVLVPIRLIESANVANLNFEVAYDLAVIRPEGELDKGNLLENALFKTNADQPGVVLVGFAQTSGIAGTGTVVNVPFRAIGQPGDSSPLDLTVTTINDPNGGVLEIERVSGMVTIVREDGTLPPKDDGTGGGAGSGPGSGGGDAGIGGGIQQGDCDGSGTVNELDALCALEMSVGLREERPFVDVDGVVGVTSRDAVVILQRAVGK